MDNVKILQRQIVLDQLLDGPEPVSSEAIFSEWKKAGIRARYDSNSTSLRDQYSLLLRQDLHVLSKLYAESLLSEPPFEQMLIIGRADGNRKMRTYHYSRPDFSMKPLIEEKYMRSDWSALDTQLDKLMKKVPDSLSEKISFFVRSRLDILNGRPALVEWTDPISIGWYSKIPELYRYVRKQCPVSIDYKFYVDDKGEYDTAVIHPYLIKSYRGRWYCLAFVEEKNRILPLAIDRIKPGSIKKVSGKTFVGYSGEKDSKGRIDYFDDIIGVTKGKYGDYEKDKYNTDSAFDLVLKIHNYKVWWYLKTDPIHSSYTIVDNYNSKQEYGRVKFHLRGNIEMYKNILYLGPEVEVESPDFVRVNVKELVEKFASLYRD